MATHRFASVIALGIAITGAVYFPGRCLAQGNEPNVDEMGCPNLTIFPKLVNSVVVSCQRGDSIEVTMPLKPDDQGYAREKTVRGVYEFREFQIPQEQQEHAFQDLIQLADMAGFTVKYSDNFSTITARNGDAWVLLRVGGEYYDVKVVRVKEEPWTPPFKNAEEISREMNTNGRAAIYGIAFSPDNQAVMEETSKIIEEILFYLNRNPSSVIDVESHMMSHNGTAENDQQITRKRAKAVVNWLEAHGIAAGRLHPKALGRNKPVTDNDTPLEVQRNERIELAKTDAS